MEPSNTTILRVMRRQIVDNNKEKQEDASRLNLETKILKNIQTTMIGAISAIETRIGHLWGYGKQESELTEDELAALQIWKEIRKAILDNGNNQGRKVQDTLKEYSINWKGTNDDKQA
jgi:predicted hydrocarbon binding protein